MRKRQYKTNADRQAAYRARQKAKLAKLTRLAPKLTKTKAAGAAPRKTAKPDSTLTGLLTDMIAIDKKLRRAQPRSDPNNVDYNCNDDGYDPGFEAAHNAAFDAWGRVWLDEVMVDEPEFTQEDLRDLWSSLNALSEAFTSQSKADSKRRLSEPREPLLITVTFDGLVQEHAEVDGSP